MSFPADIKGCMKDCIHFTKFCFAVSRKPLRRLMRLAMIPPRRAGRLPAIESCGRLPAPCVMPGTPELSA
ncbi:MAG: hypothetical protein KJ011_03425 [Burkholderiaceae bacterium]|nr:hypothetical protein [Burkholderiaceae bacterium]